MSVIDEIDSMVKSAYLDGRQRILNRQGGVTPPSVGGVRVLSEIRHGDGTAPIDKVRNSQLDTFSANKATNPSLQGKSWDDYQKDWWNKRFAQKEQQRKAMMARRNGAQQPAKQPQPAQQSAPTPAKQPAPQPKPTSQPQPAQQSAPKPAPQQQQGATPAPKTKLPSFRNVSLPGARAIGGALRKAQNVDASNSKAPAAGTATNATAQQQQQPNAQQPQQPQISTQSKMQSKSAPKVRELNVTDNWDKPEAFDQPAPQPQPKQLNVTDNWDKPEAFDQPQQPQQPSPDQQTAQQTAQQAAQRTIQPTGGQQRAAFYGRSSMNAPVAQTGFEGLSGRLMGGLRRIGKPLNDNLVRPLVNGTTRIGKAINDTVVRPVNDTFNAHIKDFSSWLNGADPRPGSAPSQPGLPNLLWPWEATNYAEGMYPSNAPDPNNAYMTSPFIKSSQDLSSYRGGGAAIGALTGGALAGLLSLLYYNKGDRKKQSFARRMLKTLLWTGLGAAGGGALGFGVGHIAGLHKRFKENMAAAKADIAGKPKRTGNIYHITYPENKTYLRRQDYESYLPTEYLKNKLLDKHMTIGHSALLITDPDGGNARVIHAGPVNGTLNVAPYGATENGKRPEFWGRGVSTILEGVRRNNPELVRQGYSMLNQTQQHVELWEQPLGDIFKGKSEEEIAKGIADLSVVAGNFGDTVHLHAKKNVDINFVEAFLRRANVSYNGVATGSGGGFGALKDNCGTTAREGFDAADGGKGFSHFRDLLMGGLPILNEPGGKAIVGKSWRVENRPQIFSKDPGNRVLNVAGNPDEWKEVVRDAPRWKEFRDRANQLNDANGKLKKEVESLKAKNEALRHVEESMPGHGSNKYRGSGGSPIFTM